MAWVGKALRIPAWLALALLVGIVAIALVVGAVRTVSVAMNLGCNAVLLIAAGIYAIAFLALDRVAVRQAAA